MLTTLGGNIPFEEPVMKICMSNLKHPVLRLPCANNRLDSDIHVYS